MLHGKILEMLVPGNEIHAALDGAGHRVESSLCSRGNCVTPSLEDRSQTWYFQHHCEQGSVRSNMVQGRNACGTEDGLVEGDAPVEVADRKLQMVDPLDARFHLDALFMAQKKVRRPIRMT